VTEKKSYVKIDMEAVMGFFGILNVYFSRIDMSIAIVAMVGRESVTKADSNVTLCDAG